MITGTSIINQAHLLFMVGPHELVVCLPYGAVTFSNTGKVTIAIPIQIYSNVKKVASVIMLKYIRFL